LIQGESLRVVFFHLIIFFAVLLTFLFIFFFLIALLQSEFTLWRDKVHSGG
jgi:hypothetical protein